MKFQKGKYQVETHKYSRLSKFTEFNLEDIKITLDYAFLWVWIANQLLKVYIAIFI